MAIISAAHRRAGVRVPARAIAAVVAPYDDDGAHARQFARRGQACVAVSIAHGNLPAAYADASIPVEYEQTVAHEGAFRRLLKYLRALGVSDVVPGGPLGVELSERLAQGLGLGGNSPATTHLRTSRAAQSVAMSRVGLASPRTFHTSSLTEALRWAGHHNVSECVVAAADSSISSASVCRTEEEISIAWKEHHQEARRQTGSGLVVIRENVIGARYLVNSFSDTWGPENHTEHNIMQTWAEVLTEQNIPEQSRLLLGSSLLSRSLSLYVRRVLNSLDVRSGFTRCCIAYTRDRGPVLLSARSFQTATDLQDLSMTSNDREPLHVAKVQLIAPRDGTLDGRILHALTSLRSVIHLRGNLKAGVAVRRTVDASSSPGELVLAASTKRAVDEDCRIIRAMEAMGLYEGSV